MFACLGVTCHLHFWQNVRGLLRATAVTRGWNGHRIRVSTQSELWRIKFSRRFCWDSNSKPFDHECGALTTELYGALCPSLPTCKVFPYIQRNINILLNLQFSSFSLRHSDFPSPKGVQKDSWGEILSVYRTCHLELSFFLY